MELQHWTSVNLHIANLQALVRSGRAGGTCCQPNCELVLVCQLWTPKNKPYSITINVTPSLHLSNVAHCQFINKPLVRSGCAGKKCRQSSCELVVV